MVPELRRALLDGAVIPASPLALRSDRRWDERRQRALYRYYIAAGAGGIAVGVHTTQFAIHDSKIGLLRPLLQLAQEETHRANALRHFIRIAGICGATKQAAKEAALANELGFHAGLITLGAFKNANDSEMLRHCREISAVLPIFGFYLQPAAGGRLLPFSFWRQFFDIETVVAVKIAPFNRYQTLDVVRALAESGRTDIALYTGNDDSIVLDLITPFRFQIGGQSVEKRMAGGLLGHWAVWTKAAVELWQRCREISVRNADIPADLLREAIEISDANAAFFDVAHGFKGCIAGLHEVLRRQGLLESIVCLDPAETLSPGQPEEIDRVYRAYPHLNDDEFVRAHLDDWLR